MTLDELYKKMDALDKIMSDAILNVEMSATKTQGAIFQLLLEQVEFLKVEDGILDPTQDLSKRFAIIQNKMETLIAKTYLPDLKPYFSSYQTVEDQSVSLHKSFNDIEVDVKKLSPQRQAIYTQAQYYLTEGLSDAYIQPAKFLMMQQVTSGVGINQMRTALKQWNDGELPAGKTASDIHAPRLQAYSTQIARDTLHTYQGAIQDVISKEYELTRFIYVGNLLKDSRSFCKHLVGLRRKISLDEIPALVIKYPNGLKPNTTKKNFLLYRGGFSCRHTCMVVK